VLELIVRATKSVSEFTSTTRRRRRRGDPDEALSGDASAFFRGLRQALLRSQS